MLSYYGLGVAYQSKGETTNALGKVRLLRSLGADDLAANLEEVMGITQAREERMHKLSETIAKLRALGLERLADRLEQKGLNKNE